METTENYLPRHRADRQERAPLDTVGVLWMNPWVKCTGSAGRHHVKPCPQHHPATYAKTAVRRWKHRQAVTA